MTVRYSEDVASAKPFRLLKLLFRWRGSVYKLIVYEFSIYLAVYLFMNLVYSFILTEEQEEWVSDICAQLGRMSGYIISAVTFCLGFIIQQVYRRFCYHFLVVPWPDGFAFLVSVNVRGHDLRARLLRRTMVRYAVASIILTWMNFSERMKVLFPDLDCLILGGFLTEHEVALMKTVARPPWRQMVACSWCAAVVKRARMEGRIEDDHAYNAVLHELDMIRMRCRRLISLNNRPFPLAYLHVVIIGVYSFFSIAALAGSHRLQTQNLQEQIVTEHSRGDLWLLRLLSQLVTMLQFTICAGVLAISRALLLPFGNDDCNIDVDEIVKRHLSQAYLIVDELHGVIPEIDPQDHTSIFVSSDSVSRGLRKIKSRSPYDLDDGGDDEYYTSLGYKLSVAPKKDLKSQPAAAATAKTAQTAFVKKRSQSKLDRLLSFQQMNR